MDARRTACRDRIGFLPFPRSVPVRNAAGCAHQNGGVSAAGEFVDAALQREGDPYRADDAKSRLGSGLRFYGASVGAVRGTVRDARLRYRELSRDEITALSSELWAEPVFERRLAAVVLLQSNVTMLDNSDLTRIEGFLRDAAIEALADPLTQDVIRPLLGRLNGVPRQRAFTVIARWASDENPWLRRAARELRPQNPAGEGSPATPPAI